MFQERLRKNGITTKYGLPQHFEMYFAMGIALIFEGFLSATYHICPTDRNFQFDTVFMYILSILMISKIYQFRDAMKNYCWNFRLLEGTMYSYHLTSH